MTPITTRAYIRFKLLKAIESIQVCRAEGASIRALVKELRVGTRTLQRFLNSDEYKAFNEEVDGTMAGRAHAWLIRERGYKP